MTGPAHIFDKPNRYIGKPEPRADAARLLQGRGSYVDDKKLPRMAHAAFVRSPHAHAKILSIDTEGARAATGVVAVYSGEDLAKHVTPYVGTLTHLAGLRSMPQHPLAVDVARWQGEPVVMIIATSRALAEDACELVYVDYDELPVAVDSETALDTGTPIIHPELESNLAWERDVVAGDIDAAFAAPDVHVVEREFRFGRHTGVTLETRGTVCDYDPSAAAAKLLKRPVKFIADRFESFLTDIHARDHIVNAKMGITQAGTIVGIDFDDLTGIGPFSMYPRTSAIECNQVLNLTGAPYVMENYRAKGRVVFQNKTLMCQYRAVGHPIAMAIADGLLEDAARKIGMDPVALREINLMADDSYPRTSATGMKLDDLSHKRALRKLTELMDYDGLRKAQAMARNQGVYRGIGFVSMVEVTNPSPMFYGIGGAPIASQDGATVRLDAGGALHVSSSITEQGQGTNAILAQIAAGVFGVDLNRVKVITGDTETTPYGGGTWASRGAGIGGEAMLQAAQALKDQVLEVAGAMLQTGVETLDIRSGAVTDIDGSVRLTLADLARTVYYRGNELPNDLKPELIATRHYRVTDFPFVFTNGAMAAHVEVDIETGFVKVLHFWAVEDCGRVINPLLVDEQIRGGVVQGIGGALYEECHYSTDGQFLNATMADYMVPMASEMPEITIAHIETPTKTSVLGAKGAGEAGTGGAPAAILNAVNDALSPMGASIWQMPMTPERILTALDQVD